MHGHSFHEAIEAASRRVVAERDNFKRGTSKLVSIAELRRRGVTPQPVD